MERNKIKPDTILKTFWRDNEHFADLFNAALFDGRQVLKAGDLTEADTDISGRIRKGCPRTGQKCGYPEGKQDKAQTEKGCP